MFLFNKYDKVSIGKLKQSKSSQRNFAKPRMFVIFDKGRGLAKVEVYM